MKKRQKAKIIFQNVLTIGDKCSIIIKPTFEGDFKSAKLIIENWTTQERFKHNCARSR